jgi:glucosyl-dolichyl phosphate glucuronosyltransferase
MDKLDVSVAVCTWNRARLLDQTLEQMCSLRVPAGLQWELLIVNNNCTDETDAVIARYQSTLPMRRLFEGEPGHCNARNCATRAARGELILWTDDDVLVDENWLAAFVEAAARHPDALGFGGPIEPWFAVAPEPDYLAAFPAMRNGFCGIDHNMPEGLLNEKQIFGANMAFRRKAHLDHPFDTKLGMRPSLSGSRRSSTVIAVGGGDECDLVQKIRARGGHIVWVPSMRVRHYVDPSRMTMNYIRLHTMDLARQSIHWQGIPPGKRIFGVPAWLIREWFNTSAACCFSLFLRDGQSLLKQRYSQWRLTGMIMGCVEWRDETRQIRRGRAPDGERSALSEIRGN